MHLSTKGRYGIRALIDLGLRSKKTPLKDIAKDQDISVGYLEQVFSLLKKAGIVKSSKGAGGGYQLATDPKTLSLYDILSALEGDLDYKKGDQAKTKMDRFLQNDVWQPLDQVVKDHLDQRSLGDLIDAYQKENDHLMYYI